MYGHDSRKLILKTANWKSIQMFYSVANAGTAIWARDTQDLILSWIQSSDGSKQALKAFMEIKIFHCQFRHFTTSSLNLHDSAEQKAIQWQTNKCLLKNMHLATYRLCCTSWDMLLYSNLTLWLIIALCNPFPYILFRQEKKSRTSSICRACFYSCWSGWIFSRRKKIFEKHMKLHGKYLN